MLVAGSDGSSGPVAAAGGACDGCLPGGAGAYSDGVEIHPAGAGTNSDTSGPASGAGGSVGLVVVRTRTGEFELIDSLVLAQRQTAPVGVR